MTITETPVHVGIHACRMGRLPGKPRNFSPEQETALRDGLKWYVERNSTAKHTVTQGEIAKILGVEQQTVSYWMAGKGGPTYLQATAIAALVGFRDGVDSYFRSKGLGRMVPNLEPWEREREDAKRRIQDLVSPAAIAYVDKKVGPEYHPAKWWTSKYLDRDESMKAIHEEALARQANDREPKDPPASQRDGRTRRKRAG